MVAPVQAVVSASLTSVSAAPVAFGAPTTLGNTIFVSVSNDTSVPCTLVTDDATPTNVYVPDVVVAGATSFSPTNAAAFRATTFRPATTITAHFGIAVSNVDIMAGEYPGKWSFEDGASAFNAANPPTPSSGNFANSHIGDLMLGFLAGFTGTPVTGWTQRLSVSRIAWEDRTAAAVLSTNNAGWTGGFAGWIMVAAAYSNVAAGPPPNALFPNTD